MKSRILVAVVGVPILLYVVLWAPAEVMEVGLALLSAVAGYELMKCMGAGGAWRRAAAAAAAVYVLAVSVAEEDVEALVVGYVIAFFLCAILKAGEIPVQLVLGALFAAIAIPYAFTALRRGTGAICCCPLLSALPAIPVPFLPVTPLESTSWRQRSAPIRRWRARSADWWAMRCAACCLPM